MENIKVLADNEIQEDFEIPDHVDMWFDRHTKSWIIQTKDKYNNQIGDAEYITGKRSALKVKQERENNLIKELNR